MNKQLLLAGAAGLVLLAASSAQAQSVDYGSMQQMFNEPVTTSATGSPQRSTEVPVDMTIISADEIHRSGATDLPTILSHVPGIDILNFSAAQSDVGIRGYDQARSGTLLVLVDGRQVYLDHFGYTDWNLLPVQLSEIRQIEVVRGANSAIFGFNAAAGVINIITYNPKYDDTNVVEARVGTLDSVNLSLVKTLHLGNFESLRISGGYQRQDEWSRDGSTVLASDVANPTTLQANIESVTQITPKVELRLEGSYSNDDTTQTISTYAYAPQRGVTKSGKAALDADTDFGLIQAQVYHNDLDADVPGRRYLNNITVGSLQDIFKIGADNTFRVGLEYRDNQMDTSSFSGARVSYTVWAPSAMWNWAVNNKLALTAAVREDTLQLGRSGPFPVGDPVNSNSDWDKSFSETSVNLGAVYKLTTEDTLRATYARGVQAPTLLELGGLLIPLGGGLLIAGNPDLAPTIVTNYELSYDRAIPQLDAKVSAKIFFQEMDDVKGQFSGNILDIYPTLTTNAVLSYENVSDSDMAGFELSASGKIKGGFHWNADTTYTNVVDASYTNDQNLIFRKVDYSATSPKFRGNLAGGWAGGPWTVDGYIHYVTKFDSYNGNVLQAVPSYASFAGRIAYRFHDGVELGLNGQNLLTEQQAQAMGNAGLKAERRVMFSVLKTW